MLETLVDLIGFVIMFALSIGVPIALTLLVGRWLEKRLRPQEEEMTSIETMPQTARASNVVPMRQTTRANNIIPMRCWHIKRCPEAQRAQCAAFQRPDLPCWLALQATGGKVHEECFTCAFYKPQTMAA